MSLIVQLVHARGIPSPFIGFYATGVGRLTANINSFRGRSAVYCQQTFTISCSTMLTVSLLAEIFASLVWGKERAGLGISHALIDIILYNRYSVS